MLTTQRPTKPDAAPDTPRPAAVQLRARRSPKLIALGVLLVTLGGLAAAFLFSLNSEQRPVLVMERDVRRSAVIAPEDLAVIEVPGGLQLEALPPESRPDIVGQQALSDLPRGSFPQAHHVGADPLPEGQSLVGLRLPHGRLPATELFSGTVVSLVSLADGDDSAIAGVLSSPPVALEDGTFSVDVLVADVDAARAAKLGATDLLALMVTEEA